MITPSRLLVLSFQRKTLMSVFLNTYCQVCVGEKPRISIISKKKHKLYKKKWQEIIQFLQNCLSLLKDLLSSKHLFKIYSGLISTELVLAVDFKCRRIESLVPRTGREQCLCISSRDIWRLWCGNKGKPHCWKLHNSVVHLTTRCCSLACRPTTGTV